MKISSLFEPSFINVTTNSDRISSTSNDTNTTQQKELQKEENKAQKSYEELSTEEKQLVSKLQARDTEVRAHEAAHQAAGAGMAGGASFSYQKGPDGKMYAIGGEVPISFKQGRTPEETIANARQVKAAAMAPANPSPQDYAVANTATMMELKAQQELIKEMQNKMNGEKTYNELGSKESSSDVIPF